MYTLSNIAQHRFSATTDTVYVVDLQQVAAGLATSSSEQLWLLDPGRLDGPVAAWPTPHTVMRVFDGHESLVCTAGQDGHVDMWDLRKGGSVLRLKAAQAPILSMSCSSPTHTIAIGTELHNHTASLLTWDVRSTTSPQSHFQDLHSDDITALAFHASHPHMLLSGSTDGLVNVYDTRVADEEDVTTQTFNHDASVHRAAFLHDTAVVALSHDEQFAVYDVREDEAERSFGDLRTVLGCRYVADVMPKTDGSGVIGAGAHDRDTFELVLLTEREGQWVLDEASRVGLPGAHGGEVVRAFCFYDDAQLVFTAGEDGCVKAWRPSS